ncbi:hypothetical protein [Erwinia oleae]|uniref:hypothetical protein n=1 Tax=Erwinia oleae TaxID=796334 RepID=UPI0005563F91|nr:hypothetical protein [Erwinia oleae]
MPTIKTILIEGTKPEADTMSLIQEKMGTQTEGQMNFMVFEVTYDHHKYYCCWSGGEIQNGEPKMTLVGQAALEALANLPLGNNDQLIIKELKLGPTPLRNKIKATLKETRPNAKICFIGDMQGELDGHMTQAFNLQQGAVKISH